jgi:hypothetical protein
VNKKVIYPGLEQHVLEFLSALPKNKNAKLIELTEHTMNKVDTFPKIKQADAYHMVSRLLGKLKRAKTVKYVGGKGCGWRLP